ncbi:MAG TPA: ABC transporter substrate-binding protein [Acidimicrobiales bacterium]|nr:ABC transporter substrate-binding protein [Acidimicrobiales bacterium]
MTFGSRSRMGHKLATCGTIASLMGALVAGGGPGVADASTPSTSGFMPVAMGGPHNPVTDSFNPFLSTSTLNDILATSLVYEPLLMYDMATTPNEQPWLATSYAWSNDDKTLTFNLRHGVAWSDGKGLTSADVVFTFDLLKKFPALNTNGIVFSSVSAPNAYQVVFHFAAPEGPELYYIGGLTYIVPQHQWASVSNPAKYVDSDPIGTGPFVLQSESTANETVTFAKNPHYWQAGPYIPGVQFNIYNSNTGVTQALQDNAIDWGSAATTQQIIRGYENSSPNHHFTNVSIPLISYLYPNLAKWPTNNLAVREALSDAVSRTAISVIGEASLFAPDFSPTGLVLPLQKSYLDPQYAHANYSVSDSKAIKVLKAAGFKMGGNGVMEKDGKPLDITLITPGGWTDYVSDAQIMQQELKPVGISLSINTSSVGAYTSALDDGTFQVALAAPTYGPTPYYAFNSIFNTTLGAPVGQQASQDWERWSDAKTNSLLLAASEGGAAAQGAYNQLESYMVNQLPVIPMVIRSNDGLYNTTNFTGFPSNTSNRYDGSTNDLGAAMLKIHPK